MQRVVPATELEPKPASLLGHRVTFTGRLATLTRPQAENLVKAAGGKPVATVGPSTTMLIVGMGGWPLLDNGKLTEKLAAAERIGPRCQILCEEAFRERIGIAGSSNEPRAKSLTLNRVCETLKVEPAAVRRWEMLGLVRSRDGLYDFQDLVSLRAVAELTAKGVGASQLSTSLRALAAHLPGIDRPLAQLNVLISHSGSLAAELEEVLLTPSGQLELNFATRRPAESTAVPIHSVEADARSNADREFDARLQAAVDIENAGDMKAAEAEYRRLIERWPTRALPYFNLGTVLLSQGRYADALRHFELSLQRAPGHAAAWFNRAHAFEQLHRLEEAKSSLCEALKIDADYADAHFNLADVAEKLGDRALAERAWSAYLRHDPFTEWAVEARRRLHALRGPAWA